MTCPLTWGRCCGQRGKRAGESPSGRCDLAQRGPRSSGTASQARPCTRRGARSLRPSSQRKILQSEHTPPLPFRHHPTSSRYKIIQKTEVPFHPLPSVRGSQAAPPSRSLDPERLPRSPDFQLVHVLVLEVEVGLAVVAARPGHLGAGGRASGLCCLWLPALPALGARPPRAHLCRPLRGENGHLRVTGAAAPMPPSCWWFAF